MSASSARAGGEQRAKGTAAERRAYPYIAIRLLCYVDCGMATLTQEAFAILGEGPAREVETSCNLRISCTLVVCQTTDRCSASQ